METQSKEVQLEIKELDANFNLFKIFGYGQFSFEKAYAPSLVDWSGFYTQLNPQHSLRYLTKKWDDGADYGCLVLLKPLKPMKLIKICSAQLFADPTIAGQQKARMIKSALRNKANQMNEYKDFNIKEEEMLLKLLGQKQTLLQCVDMQENQIIIPHDLLNQNYFIYLTLVVFKKSKDGLLRTIGWHQYKPNCQNQPNWTPVKGQSQYEPHLLLKDEPLIKEIISKLMFN